MNATGRDVAALEGVTAQVHYVVTKLLSKIGLRAS